MRWAYGVTTVPRRREEYFARSLRSLEAAGFGRYTPAGSKEVYPRLFVDGACCRTALSYEDEFGLPVTPRGPTPTRAYGNWVLALAELYVREPNADRYALFQDDLLAPRNLRRYLDRCGYPAKGYWNLYTMPANQALARKHGDRDRENGTGVGWFPSNQRGLGAVGLVFSLEAVLALLTNQSPVSVRHMADRPRDATRGHKAIDGGVVDALRKAGWTEYVHDPSLLWHTGRVSAIGNRPQPDAARWPGEDYDCLEMLKG